MSARSMLSSLHVHVNVHVLQTFLQPRMRKLSIYHTKSLQKIAVHVFSIAIVWRKDIFINLNNDDDNGLLQIPPIKRLFFCKNTYLKAAAH